MRTGDQHPCEYAKAIGREIKLFDEDKWLKCRFEIVVKANLGVFQKIINQPRWSMRPSSALCQGLHRLTMRPSARLEDDPLSGVILINDFLPDALAKFSHNVEQRKFFISTGDRVLVEASLVDKIWCIGLEKNNPSIEHPSDWQGLNLLGYALMEVRSQLSN
jgi:predicted NAD-dependent protein-ADP-ribosyltransferase YbiA (DUF1768 family)